jgi:hypothetical protein
MRCVRIVTLALAVVSLPSVVFAQDAPARGWIDINFGASMSGADAETFVFGDTLFSEPFGLAAAYGKPPRGAEFDFGGGVMLSSSFGLGINFSGTTHEDTVGLAINVPHPFFFNSSAIDGNVTSEELARTEGAANFQAMFVPVNSSAMRVRLFGGPSFFRYRADMVRDIQFDQFAPIFSSLNVVEITGYEAVEAEGSGWGFHVGADASYFFSRIVGVGGFVRYGNGTVSVDEPMSEQRQDIKVGGFQSGGGLRLRF